MTKITTTLSKDGLATIQAHPRHRCVSMTEVGSSDILEYEWRLAFDLNSKDDREMIIFEEVKRAGREIGMAKAFKDGTVEFWLDTEVSKQELHELRESFKIIAPGYLNRYEELKDTMTDEDLFKVTGDKSLTMAKVTRVSKT